VGLAFQLYASAAGFMDFAEFLEKALKRIDDSVILLVTGILGQAW
jgi:hypothetical protein